MDNTFQCWLKQFQKATDFDAWGQPIEAAEIYLKLSKQISAFKDANRLLLNEKQAEFSTLMVEKLERRSEAITTTNTTKEDEISLQQIKELHPAFCQFVSQLERRQSMIETASNVLTRFQERALSLDTGEVESDNEEHQSWLNEISNEKLSNVEPGKSYLTIKIEKMGIKEASSYNSPFIVVSVRDSIGLELTPSQKTPFATRIEGNWIHIDTIVAISKPLDDMPPGLAIFFEFKHYKEKKKYYSTKCFSFIENDELKNGPMMIEL
ncbi:hypothetical protein CHUAL_013437 [Chamberlinius hualienensis]